MRIMDAKAAAEEIHGVVEGRLHPTAEDRHIQGFVTEVCNELGLEPSAVNVAIVADALREADIQPHQVQAYPKMAVDENGKAILLDPMGKRLPVDARGLSTVDGVPGHHVIFENEEEEKHFGTPKEGDVVEPFTGERRRPLIGPDGKPVLDEKGNPVYVRQEPPYLDEQGMPHYGSDAAAVHDAQPRAFAPAPAPRDPLRAPVAAITDPPPVPAQKPGLSGQAEKAAQAETDRKTAADKAAAETADARYAADVKAKQDAEDLARRNQPRVPA